ncbi:hypothetical protein HN51_040345 [Arachis hypogaea]|uniref:Auxin-induced protein n=1 Tax=Arachis hypogaea TaxID=3818 RepID=A0A444YNJ3_ARAHY|nr:auxin-responsive protein SAUR21-like [Arachis ipaensis]XP_025660887.1 auxin-responsive protein SAUR21-like [Arachis hypogaea]RYR03471.1 hypothetical protein Ahy_B06g082446 [Arachis hypogaea]
MEVIIRRKSLKSLVTKVVKGLAFLALSKRAYPITDIDDDSDEEIVTSVPEGHFAVIAMEGGDEEEKKRFMIELNYLTDPAFLKLLEMAKEEYGFQHKGALALPCTPQQLRNVLHNHQL